jgi:ElaB/YqjD/DUF883 family membrane-anchored ribosome-binding protein
MDPRAKDPTIGQRIDETTRPEETYRRTSSTESALDEARRRTEAATDDVQRKARETAERGADKIDQAMTKTGAQLNNLAHTMRERRPQGQVGEMTTATADALERGGRYLQDHDLNDVRGDLEHMIRRYPMQSLLITAGLGFLAARKMKR